MPLPNNPASTNAPSAGAKQLKAMAKAVTKNFGTELLDSAFGTEYTMSLDFSTPEQNAVLAGLQAEGFHLVGFRGAVGDQQIRTGVPAWFAEPFANFLQMATITYQPSYVVYAYDQHMIAERTVITMTSQSSPIGLGRSLSLSPSGLFNSGGVAGVPSDSIGLLNNRPAECPPLTVGLAAIPAGSTDNTYQPFCAFSLPSQNAIIMKPLDRILLMAARIGLRSGEVVATASAPAALFDFNATTSDYELEIVPGSYQIIGEMGTSPVNRVSAGLSTQVVNSVYATGFDMPQFST